MKQLYVRINKKSWKMSDDNRLSPGGGGSISGWTYEIFYEGEWGKEIQDGKEVYIPGEVHLFSPTIFGGYKTPEAARERAEFVLKSIMNAYRNVCVINETDIYIKQENNG